MLDRLISGAGAVTDGADRSVRLLAGGPRGGFVTTRPVSLAVAVILVILAAMLVLAGIEATDPPLPVPLAATDVAAARDLGDRTYSTMSGSLSSAYVETYADDNGNGTEDPGENTIAWYYFLIDPVGRTGVTVRSTRPPEAVLTFRGSGILVAGAHYTRESYAPYEAEAARVGLQIEKAVVLDATAALAGPGTLVDLARRLPSGGTSAEVSGAWLGSYVGVCTDDPDLDGVCDPDEEDQYEILIFDRVSRHAIRVLVNDIPEFSAASTITGSLRRAERAVDAAKQAVGMDLASLDLNVSDRYVLEEAGGPGSAPLAFALAGGLFALAAVILVGLAGGYLIYQRSDARPPISSMTLEAGEGIPVRITGRLRTPTGLEHVREAPGRLIRFVSGRPIVDHAEAPQGAAAVTTTLIVQRDGHPHGVALGPGEVTRLSLGRVMALRAPRPAVRVIAGTGPLLLSFDSEGERDRAASELLDETGLGPDGRLSQTT